MHVLLIVLKGLTGLACSLVPFFSNSTAFGCRCLLKLNEYIVGWQEGDGEMQTNTNSNVRVHLVDLNSLLSH